MSAAFACAILSALCNGSYIVPYKHNAMKDVRPLVFQFYCGMGVMLSAFLLIPFFPMNGQLGYDDDRIGTSFDFSGFGVLGGMIFVCAMALSFLAVELIGIGE